MKTKKHYIELLRVLAIFFVILNHTGNNGYSLYLDYRTNSFDYWLYLSISIITTFAVPMFLTISGGLLLNKQEEISKIFKKRIVKILIGLIIFSFIYYLYFNFENFNIWEFIKVLYQDQNNHLWYSYFFIAFLLSLPILQSFISNLSNKQIRYILICYSIFTLISLFELYLTNDQIHLNSSLHMNWMRSKYFIYPLIGYYIEHRLDVNKAKKYLGLLWFASVFVIGLTAVVITKRIEVLKITDDILHQSLIYVLVFTLYLSFKLWFKNLENNIIKVLGSLTYGTYLIHLLIYNLLVKYGIYEMIELNMMLSTLIVCFIVMLISFIIIWILRKITLIKKIF